MQSFALSTIFILISLSSLSIVVSSSKPLNPCNDDFLHIQAYKQMQNQTNTTQCKKLSSLQAQFAWNYHKTSHNQTQLNILIGTKLITTTGWLAWGINPDLPRMVGTRAIIAVKVPSQITPSVNTYNITKDIQLGCKLQPSGIDFMVQNMTVVDDKDVGFFSVFATLVLPQRYNVSSLNHVWQVGYCVDGLEPKMHEASLGNLDSKEILDLETGDCQNIGQHRRHMRKVHGILNIIGWGTLLPIGVIVARYFKQFPIKLDPCWYYFHYSCQVVGYILGTAGWGLGLFLGHESKYYTFHSHRVLGICIFGFTTLQVTQILAFQFKPTQEDEYRKHWNVYHHFLGYALLVMIPVNIYKGIKLLKPDNITWKWTYNGILVLLGVVVLAFEILTWAVFLYKKCCKKTVEESSPRRVEIEEDSKGQTNEGSSPRKTEVEE
ncbi:hypothetical protein ES319_D05G414600v1 [Gossypium barbadense]|uniref:Cytochrome b561 and DOMON domain-containing protein n=2 Tax=Gossypium TaxID=3633 RepID=A0A5J5RNM4_GOSBA|nr:hypothetical protein ES319_D05G414600v1 [Gossypium barbadense]TYH74939.1 hypothetical protein ES332_D05G438200v1 [Gossypium tomentosum]